MASVTLNGYTSWSCIFKSIDDSWPGIRPMYDIVCLYLQLPVHSCSNGGVCSKARINFFSSADYTMVVLELLCAVSNESTTKQR